MQEDNTNKIQSNLHYLVINSTYKSREKYSFDPAPKQGVPNHQMNSKKTHRKMQYSDTLRE